MASADEVEVVPGQKVVYHIAAIVVADSPLQVIAPPFLPCLWIRPQHIRNQFVVQHLHWSPDLIEAGQVLDQGTQSSVDTEDPFSHDCCYWQIVEGVCDHFPQFGVQSAFAFVEEPIELIEFAGFVVTSEEEEGVRVAHLVGQQQQDTLEGLFAPVHIVAQKKVILFGWRAENAENGEEVLELSVDVSANLNGGFQFEEEGLFLEDVAGHGAESFNFSFFEYEELVSPGRSFSDADDDVVNIDGFFLGVQHGNRTQQVENQINQQQNN